jgi:phage terminase small subunit
MAKNTEILPENKKLLPKEKKFADLYVIYLNGAKSAREAGYSIRNDRHIAMDLLTKVHIKAYIAQKLDAATMSAEEVTRRLTNRASLNMADYMTIRQVPYTPKIRKPLDILMCELEAEIAFEDELMLDSDYDEMEIAAYISGQKYRRNTLKRFALELKKNAKAFRIVDGPTQLVDRQELDLNKVVADKEKGYIKSYANTQFGIKVEMCSSDEAIIAMARIHGKFEKDNEQRAPVTNMKIGYGKEPTDGENG